MSAFLLKVRDKRGFGLDSVDDKDEGSFEYR